MTKPTWTPFEIKPGERGKDAFDRFAASGRAAYLFDENALPMDRTGEVFGLWLMRDLCDALDDDMSKVIGLLSRPGRVNTEYLERNGLARPSVVMDASLTAAGTLMLVLREGPGSPHHTYLRDIADKEWRSFPDSDARRTPNGVALKIWNAGCLFADEETLFHRIGRTYTLEIAKSIKADLDNAALAVWRHCREVLSGHYFVYERTALVAAGPGGTLRIDPVDRTGMEDSHEYRQRAVLKQALDARHDAERSERSAARTAARKARRAEMEGGGGMTP